MKEGNLTIEGQTKLLHTTDSAPRVQLDLNGSSYERSIAFFKELGKHNSHNFSKLPNIISTNSTNENTLLKPLRNNKKFYKVKLPNLPKNLRNAYSPPSRKALSRAGARV